MNIFDIEWDVYAAYKNDATYGLIIYTPLWGGWNNLGESFGPVYAPNIHIVKYQNGQYNVFDNRRARAYGAYIHHMDSPVAVQCKLNELLKELPGTVTHDDSEAANNDAR